MASPNWMQIIKCLNQRVAQPACHIAFTGSAWLAYLLLALLLMLALPTWAVDLALADTAHSSTTWQDYRGWILSAVGAVLVQAMTITVLVVNRRRRLAAERLLRQSEESYHARLDAALAQKRQYEEGLRLLLALGERSVEMTERQICDGALEIAVSVTSSEIGYLHLLNDDQNTISLVTWNTEALKHCTASYDTHYPIADAGLWADCARTLKTVIHNDYQHMTGKKSCPVGHSHLLRHMSTPALDGQLVRMIVGVGNKAIDYTEEDSQRLQMVANEVQKIVMRRRAEQALGESENRFRFIADLSPSMIWVSDVDKLCTWFNKTWLSFTGRAMAQELGTGWTSGVHAQDVEACVTDYVRHFEARQPFALEYRMLRHDGQYRWILDLGQPRLGVDGEFKGYVGTCFDITERKQTELQLEIFRTFFTLSQDMMAITSQDGYLQQVNRAFTTVLGYSEEELKARPFYELVLPEDLEATRDEARRQLRGSVTFNFENRYRCKDGTVRKLSWCGFADIARGVRYSTARDVTDLREAQEKLIKLGLAVEQTSQSVVITNRQACIEYVNRAFCQVTGYAAADVMGRNPRILQSGLTPPATFVQMWEALNRGETWLGEFTNRRKNGEHYVEAVRISPVRQTDGTVTHYLAIKEEITAQKRAAETIQRSKTLLQNVIDSSPDWIFVKDAEHRFVLVNETFARVFKQVPDALIGHFDTDFIPIDLCVQNPRTGEPGLHALDDAVFRGELIHLPQEQVSLPGDKPRVFETFKMPLRDSQQKIFGNLCYSRDITDRLSTESGQRSLEKQLQQAQKMELIGHLTGGIAHDFNNILASMLGYAELIQMSAEVKLDPKIQAYVHEILQAGIRARELVRQLLVFSQKRETVFDAIFVAPIVKEVVQLLRSTLPTSILMTLEMAKNLPQVKMSSVQLHQVLMNLGVNARDAIDGVGKIEIMVNAAVLESLETCDSCHQTFAGDYLVMTVRDNGAGISQETQPRIFDPFFTTKGIGLGSGLGLSVVHGIVHAAGGHIRVLSGPGVGTEFRIYLPSQSPGAMAQSPSYIINQTDNVGVQANVMVVDDEAPIVGVVTALLESIGCKVTGLTSSTEALRLFRDKPHAMDLIITDLTMPDLDGIELARAMLELRADIPIIMSTGYSASIDDDQATKLGLRQLLLKPVPAKVLLDAVVRQLHPKLH